MLSSVERTAVTLVVVLAMASAIGALLLHPDLLRREGAFPRDCAFPSDCGFPSDGVGPRKPGAALARGGALARVQPDVSLAIRTLPPAAPHALGDAFVWSPLAASVSALARAAGPAPVSLGVITMLHGACGAPGPVCAPWGQEAASFGWLVCPEGNLRCSGGQADWRGSGEVKAAHLDRLREALETRYGGWLGEGEVLAGFSRGAFAARDIAFARPGRYRALILIGAAVRLEPERVRAAGLARVALVCGRYDGARASMIATTARLSAAGVSARFFDAGPSYHELPPEMAPLMTDVLGWLSG